MAEIIFTSGSLGRAKGVMLSQRNLAANLMAHDADGRCINPEDRFLSVLADPPFLRVHVRLPLSALYRAHPSITHNH